jgi:hypothetical protein
MFGEGGQGQAKDKAAAILSPESSAPIQSAIISNGRHPQLQTDKTWRPATGYFHPTLAISCTRLKL